MDNIAPENAKVLSTFNNIHGHSTQRQKRARSQLSCVPCRQGKLKCNRSHEPACDQCIKRNRESACTYMPPPVKQKPPQNVKGRIRDLENLVVNLMARHEDRDGLHPFSDSRQRTSERKDSPLTVHGRNGPIAHPTPPSDHDSSPHRAPDERSNDDSDGTAKSFGQMRISKGEFSYVGDAHWHAILNSIEDLKREVFLDDDDPDTDSDQNAEEAPVKSNTQPNPVPPFCPLSSGAVPMGGVQPQATTGLGFMIGHTQSMSKEQLIAAMPDKKVADRLLSLWFNSPDPFKPLIHAPTFQEEYRNFWANPRQTPSMWLGLLFSIMSLATSFALRDINPTSEQAKKILAEVNRYHTCAGAASVLADFTKPRQYTIECLILYSAGLRSSNAFVNVWLMIGTVVRLCLRMGYHRDPGNYPAISTFHGEMRRRVWAIISMLDVLISFQLGLPSLVKTIQSDTEMPRNLLDRDFSISTQVLPVSRGIHELTPSSYIRSKLRIIRIFADATELSHTTITPAHEEMMELDRRLEDARAQVPPLLQMPDISEVVTDPAEQLMCRFNLDLLYLKTKTVLHRRYMERPTSQLTTEEQESGIGLSRKICVDCALKVLQHHQTIYTCSQPGGQLESVKWYMGSISTHDFLLAAMVICLELSRQMSDEDLPPSTPRKFSTRHDAMLEALQKSQEIWSDASGRKRKVSQFVGKDELSRGEHMFDETERASRAMAAMLERVKAHQASHPERYHASPAPAPFSTPPNLLSSSNPGPTPNMHYTGTPNMDFGGIVSYHPLGELNGMDHGGLHQSYHGATGAPPLYNSDNYSQGTTNSSSTTSPEHTSSNQDIAMISDMIDLQHPVDWGTWDGVVQKTHKQQWRAGGLSYDVDMGNPENSLDNGLGLVSGTLGEPVILATSEAGDHAAGSLPVGARALGAGGGGGSGRNGAVGESNNYQPWMHSFEDLESYDMDRVLGFPKHGYWPSTASAPTPHPQHGMPRHFHASQSQQQHQQQQPQQSSPMNWRHGDGA